jgi:hypothetical protein
VLEGFDELNARSAVEDEVIHGMSLVEGGGGRGGTGQG